MEHRQEKRILQLNTENKLNKTEELINIGLEFGKNQVKYLWLSNPKVM